MKELCMGAEAKIFLDKDRIIKKRLRKGYRIQEIDSALRKTRTRTEAKILEKIRKPELISTDRTETIEMEFIDGVKVGDILDEKPELSEDIGEQVSELHDMGIIHGDLTTSNMILKDGIHLIDFGLSFFSNRLEDKAVDIHLFRQALESKHHKVCKKAYKYFLKGYKAEKHMQILERLIAVEARGRYKKK